MVVVLRKVGLCENIVANLERPEFHHYCVLLNRPQDVLAVEQNP